MKTFDRKIATYSHSSLITFFNSILDLTNLGTILETVGTIKRPLKRVVPSDRFDFIFHTSRNGRNENDKNQSLKKR